ncbi:MAG: hypothetical protein QGF46_02335 [Planctomycetota bacterium]|nr:hypothetical protein [Planctomycetota bacterium]
MTDWLDDYLDADVPADVPSDFSMQVLEAVSVKQALWFKSRYYAAASIILMLGIWIGYSMPNSSIEPQQDLAAESVTVDIDEIYLNQEILDLLDEDYGVVAASIDLTATEILDHALDMLGTEEVQ